MKTITTRQGKIIQYTISSFLGMVLIFAVIAYFVYEGGGLRPKFVYISEADVEQVLGPKPDLTTYENGWQDEEYIKDKEAYDIEYAKEEAKQKEEQNSIRDTEVKQVVQKLVGITALIGLPIATLFSVYEFRRSIGSIQLDKKRLVIQYKSGKEVTLDMEANHVEFRRYRHYSIGYLFIPQMVYQVLYTTQVKGKDRKKLERLFLRKKDINEISQILSE